MSDEKPELTRLSCNLSPHTALQLMAMRPQTGSHTASVARSVAWYAFLMNEIAEGRKILSYDPERREYRELVVV